MICQLKGERTEEESSQNSKFMKNGLLGVWFNLLSYFALDSFPIALVSFLLDVNSTFAKLYKDINIFSLLSSVEEGPCQFILFLLELRHKKCLLWAPVNLFILVADNVMQISKAIFLGFCCLLIFDGQRLDKTASNWGFCSLILTIWILKRDLYFEPK